MITTQSLISLFQKALDEGWGYIWGTAGILWDNARQNQKILYMEQKYGSGWKNSEAARKDNYYAAALYGSKWTGRKVADCSGLFRWAFAELGGSIAHGSNSIWNGYCSARGRLSGGKRTDGAELLPGTAVFTDNDGDKTHIGLYIGNGKVIEASGTIAGVITTKVSLSKWKCWGELKGVKYEHQAPAAEPAAKPTLRRGNIGPYVTECQAMLLQCGYDVGPDGADGDFGRNTEAAVKAFQKAHSLAADGIIGPRTHAALEAAVNSPDRAEKTYSVMISGLDLTQARALQNNYPGSVLREESASA